MTEEPAFDEGDLRTLGEKLATLDLNDRERAALEALIGAEEVAGFKRFDLGLIQSGIRVGFRPPQTPATPPGVPTPYPNLGDDFSGPRSFG